MPDWKKLYCLSERLASLGIMGAQLWFLLKPLATIVLWCTGGFKGAIIWDPIVPRNVSLSDSCTSDRFFFSIWLCENAWDLLLMESFPAGLFCFSTAGWWVEFFLLFHFFFLFFYRWIIGRIIFVKTACFEFFMQSVVNVYCQSFRDMM